MSVDISFSIGEHIEGRDSNPRGRERELEASVRLKAASGPKAFGKSATC